MHFFSTYNNFAVTRKRNQVVRYVTGMENALVDEFVSVKPLNRNPLNNVLQVRNAIQALQEMTSPSSGPGSGFSAHSNPNIARIPCTNTSNGILARSTSHPPEIFCWDEPPSPGVYKCLTSLVDQETQTETQVNIQQQSRNADNDFVGFRI